MTDLADFQLHKICYDVEFDGVSVPGLCAAFYRCPDGDRTLSVGIYLRDGVELFRAWGHIDTTECSHHSVTGPDGVVDGPHPGCPGVRVRRAADGRPVGLVVTTPRQEYVVDLSGESVGAHRRPVRG